MSKRERAKQIIDDAAVTDDAKWTIGKKQTGFIVISGQRVAYWTPDGKPIASDEDIPF